MSNLAVGDIAHSLGIKKTKIGGGDKNVAYIVDSNTMTYGLWIIAAVLMCFAIGFFLRNFELSIRNKSYADTLQEADELEELALERVMEIGLTLEDFLRREALEEEQVDNLELQMVRSKRALMSHLSDTMKSEDIAKAERILTQLLTPVVKFLEARKTEAVEAKLVLGEVNQMLGQENIVPEAPVDNSAYLSKEHQWEMDNLKENAWGHKDYAATTKPPSASPKKAADRLGKSKLTHGRDLNSRISKFFEGVKAATDVSFPQGFKEKFLAFKKSLGANAGDAESFAVAGRRRWDALARILKDFNIIDVDARTTGDEKLRERLLYEMYHEVDAILRVQQYEKMLNTLQAGYKSGNLGGGELLRILHSQKGLHDAFDWLFGQSENAEIMDSRDIAPSGNRGVAGGARNSKVATSSKAAKKLGLEEEMRPSAFHHSVDSDLRAKSRSDLNSRKQAGHKTQFHDTRRSASAFTKAQTETSRSARVSKKNVPKKPETGYRNLRGGGDNYDRAKVPREEKAVSKSSPSSSSGRSGTQQRHREQAVEKFLEGAADLVERFDKPDNGQRLDRRGDRREVRREDRREDRREVRREVRREDRREDRRGERRQERQYQDDVHDDDRHERRRRPASDYYDY
eukprot:CAMPEP_0114527412 /NCGR_PEP_ID=MMETSP0109-20121206/23603_1 /TAXON_ID=29199 /ORGANISM="Chlorarachnion reptans, Strain CCCM449" /LENGTH=628 /DNA_ID=CAMNT_0001709377 /DNA_START=207 /DNA_END=2093 /DNA_ORIENTATION=-